MTGVSAFYWLSFAVSACFYTVLLFFQNDFCVKGVVDMIEQISEGLCNSDNNN